VPGPCAGFPVVQATSTATTVSTPSGGSAFLGADTPFGQAFGSSQGEPYVNVSTAAGGTPSTTTLDFDVPTPAAGWGFALGDVDADKVQVRALDSHGQLVSAADLGFRTSFNYCMNTPKPSSCTGLGPFTDQPAWDAGTSTLTGNGTDTSGASGWFEPSVSLSSLTLTFTRQTGVPIFQVWLATLAVPITGVVDGLAPSDPAPAPGVVLDLEHTDHTPVVDPAGDPVTATATATGAFEFPAVVDGDYRIAIDPPARTSITGDPSTAVAVDVTAGTTRVPTGTFAVRVRPATTAPVTPAPSAANRPGPELAATGGFSGPLLALGAGLVGLGICCSWIGRRRVPRGHR
jgi:hypothetical protein